MLGFLIPTAFLGVGVFGKKLVARSTDWGWEDAYLGIELTLAAITVSAVNGCDLYRLGERADIENVLLQSEMDNDPRPG